MLTIGCHLSITKGFLNMGKVAQSIGANTFQYFTRSPRGTKAKAVDETDYQALAEFLAVNDFGPILAHAPYILNPSSKDPHLRDLATEIVADDLSRISYFPGSYYNLHPGHYQGEDKDAAIEHIATMLNTVLDANMPNTVLLETMSGKSREVGGLFEDLRLIIDRVSLQEKVGVCLDTCHVHDAGYDIVNDLDAVLAYFDQVVGIQRLKAIHINDSKNDLGSRKDRHAKIGEGTIGLEGFTRIINHPQLRHLPFYLETPCDVAGYQEEIALLRSVYKPVPR